MKVHEFCVAALMMSLLSACQPPSLGELGPECDPAVEVCPPGSAPESGSSEDSSTHEPGTTTGQEADTATTSSASSGSTGEPPVPSLIEAAVIPNPVEYSGPVTVTAQVEHADGVRMQVGDAQIELVQTIPGKFVGEFAVYSGLSNGLHEVTLTPRHSDVDGKPMKLPYEVSLPEPGSLGFWEASGLLGEAQAGAVASLPGTDEFVEAGTRFVGGEPRCYLRRRAKTGAWSDSDVVDVLPDEKCTVIDLVIDADGLHLLASREVAGVSRWWLGRIPAWAADVEHRGQGSAGEDAVALAFRHGEIAVCGNEQVAMNFGPFVAIFRADQVGAADQSFDYTPYNKPHKFAETVADCLFHDGRLVLGGAAFGPHDEVDGDPTKRNRAFLLAYDVALGTHVWTVPAPGPATQSAVTALVVDDQDRVIAGGFTCGDVCSPAAELRGYDMDGELFWQTDLPGVLPPNSLTWSPAGYLVVASALPQGPWWTAFWLQAWRPSIDVPVWTLSRDDAPALQLARTTAVGYYGLIIGVGVGAGNVPAISIVAG